MARGCYEPRRAARACVDSDGLGTRSGFDHPGRISAIGPGPTAGAASPPGLSR